LSARSLLEGAVAIRDGVLQIESDEEVAENGKKYEK